MSSPNKNMIARKKELPLQDDSSNLFLQIMISPPSFCSELPWPASFPLIPCWQLGTRAFSVR